MPLWLIAYALLHALIGFNLARAAHKQPQRVVVIVGNNRSLDRARPSLRYADDDAILYADLLRQKSAVLKVLTTLDDESQHRFPGAAEWTTPPTKSSLRASLQDAFSTIHQLRARGDEVDLWFVYIGHGSVDDEGSGYVDLQDAPFTREDLYRDIVASSPADRTHIIIDACHAYSLVAGRGDSDAESKTSRLDASATSRFDRFIGGHDLEDHPTVGVLLAATEERETHEWSRIRSGVFSHLVRSALTGAGDVNSDRRIEYSEVAAFVSSASADLGRLGKRLHIFAWPPVQERSAALLDVAPGPAQREIRLASHLGGHMQLESETGTRWAEFNKAAGTVLSLFVPANVAFFLRDADHESPPIESGSETIVLRELPSRVSSWFSSRGAVDRAFEASLFGVPFSADYYRGYVAQRPFLVSVKLPRDGEGALGVEDGSRPAKLDLAVGYALSPSVLVASALEHGVHLGLIYTITPSTLSNASNASNASNWSNSSWGIGVEVGYAQASYAGGHRSWRVALCPTVRWQYRISEGVSALLHVSVGDTLLALRGPIDSTDPSVITGSLGGGIRLGLLDELFLTASGNARGYMLTTGDRENVRIRPEFLLSVGWSLE
ncbi:MAG: caspase family protein [Deltaproteobacteria bacterium]|nr:caspase family protein [Deltaproteobacteria bacterium]